MPMVMLRNAPLACIQLPLSFSDTQHFLMCFIGTGGKQGHAPRNSSVAALCAVAPVMEIVKRVPSKQLMTLYKIPVFKVRGELFG